MPAQNELEELQQKKEDLQKELLELALKELHLKDEKKTERYIV